MVEFLDRIVPGVDGEVARQFQRLLERQGMKFKLASKVVGVEKKGAVLVASVEPATGGARETIEADAILVAIGRRAYTDGLGLDEVGVTARQTRPRRHRRSFQDQRSRHLGDRRRARRRDAGAQGRGRSGRLRRDHRRAARAT